MSEIYPFNSAILTIAIGNTEYNKKRKPDNKGYVPLYKEWDIEIDSIGNSVSYAVDSNKIKSFREFISVGKKSGAKIFVIYSPVYQKFAKKQEIEICQKICTSENVSFYDFSQDTFFLNNRQLFQDPAHLNNNGAIIFSNIIIDELLEKDKVNL